MFEEWKMNELTINQTKAEINKHLYQSKGTKSERRWEAQAGEQVMNFISYKQKDLDVFMGK